MAVHHIRKLIEEGEHQQLDFKFEISDTHKIARTLVAFANTDGGRLLIGVKDNGAIAGVRSEEEYFMVEASAGMYCNPPVSVTFKEWTLDKKRVLEVMVRRSPERPHYAQSTEGKWIAYIRVRDQNFVVNRILLRVWKKEKEPKGVLIRFTEAEKLLLSYLETNPAVTLSKFARLAGISGNKASEIIVKFMCLGMIRINFSENDTSYSLTLSHKP